MLIKTLQSLFERDLEKLKSEMEAYTKEETIWHKERNVTNSAGNLCLHLIGNLKWFIGAQLGDTGYIRQRELEFSSIHIPRTELLIEIDKTRSMIAISLNKITDDQLEAEYPIVVSGKKMSTYYFLVHLATHLAYHLGQINYHRRLLDE